jgi:hypothetical protein
MELKRIACRRGDDDAPRHGDKDVRAHTPSWMDMGSPCK